jgi:mRNA interferase MazF
MPLAVNPAKESFLIERGDIFLLEIGGQERRKQPVLVIQNDIGNRFCRSIIVVPLVPNPRLKNLLLGVLLAAGGSNGLPAEHVALFSQIMTVDKFSFRKDNFMGRPDDRALARIDEAIKLSLGLSTIQRLETKQNLLRKWRLFRGEKIKFAEKDSY